MQRTLDALKQAHEEVHELERENKKLVYRQHASVALRPIASTLEAIPYAKAIYPHEPQKENRLPLLSPKQL